MDICFTHDKEVGLGADTVLKLHSHCEIPGNHRIFFDNLFTSYHLMHILDEKGFFATGTVRANCIEKKSLPEKLQKGNHEAFYEKKRSSCSCAGVLTPMSPFRAILGQSNRK